jgi:hypothetical protein
MAKQQLVKIKLPAKIDNKTDQLNLAEEVRSFIIERSKQGLDKDNKPFAPYKGKDKIGKYSERYVSSENFRRFGKDASDLNLQLTGDMLAELKVLSTTSKSITIGYDAGNPINGKVEGNRLGTYGQPSPIQKGRDFLGIDSRNLNKITDTYKRVSAGSIFNLAEIASFIKVFRSNRGSQN